MHDPEADAARYLGDDLSAGERAVFSMHLLSCDECRSEVEQGRRGRALLEAQRSVVPVDVRDRVRALVAAASTEPAESGRSRSGPRAWPRFVPVAVAAGLVGALLLGGLTVGAVPGRSPQRAEPAALAEAVRDFTAQKLPGSGLPQAVAPDLTSLRLQQVGAGGGSYDGLAVDGYAYRDPAGRRVVLYVSDEPFPEAPDAQRLAGADGPWIAERDDVVMLCARLPHALLVVGQDRDLVRAAASELEVL